MDQCILSIAAGGTTSKAALVDLHGVCQSDVQDFLSPSQEKDFHSIITVFADKVYALQLDAQNKGCRVLCTGIGITGPADYEKGIILVDPGQEKYGALYGINLIQEMEQVTRIKTYMCNDADAFATGVSRQYPSGRVGVVTLGTGLGSAFLNNGKLQTAGNGIPSGGEIWNLPYKRNAVTGKDWLEESISKRAIMNTYHRLTGEVREVKDIAEQARKTLQGETDHLSQKAMQTFQLFADDLAEGLYLGFAAFKPQKIIFGGNISKSFDLFGERANRLLNERVGFRIHCEVATDPHLDLSGIALYIHEKLVTQ